MVLCSPSVGEGCTLSSQTWFWFASQLGSFGFLEGGEDHNTSECFGSHGEVDLSYGAAPAPLPACTWQALPGVALHNFYDNSSVDIGGYNPWRPSSYDNETGCARLCANRVDCAGYTWRSADPTHDMFHKCFLISLTAASGVANPAFQSALCTREPLANTTWTARDLVGTYTGDSFSACALPLIASCTTDSRSHAHPRLLDTALVRRLG